MAIKDLKRFIDHLECPIVDGIIFPDERIALLDVDISWKKPYEYNIKLLTFITVEKLRSEHKLWTGFCSILAEYLDVVNNVKVICGEASHGGDGFIGVVNDKTGYTIWIAFFTESNPFCKVKVEENYVIAVSTLNCIWKIDIANPVNIEVTAVDTLTTMI